jgi:coenzyme F420 biosynthesis associated uncharacterized protein
VTRPVDWALAERVALRLGGREPLAESYHASSLVPDFAAFTAEAEELVAIETGLRSQHGPARARVLDRPAWIRANLASFERLLRPLLSRLEERMGTRTRPVVRVGAAVAGAELGTLLGWMSGRVLGQYDLLVVDDETATEQDLVYYVGPNVLALEKRFGFPPGEFRLWLALHEVTHRAQFTGVPWLRPYFLGLVEQAVGTIEPDPERLVRALKEAVRGRAGQAFRDGGLLQVFAPPEQREVLARIAGLMSLLEGHGDVTMDRAGRGRVPQADRFSRVLRARREAASAPVRMLQRLTGIEAKLNQYEQGERFLAAIEEVGGKRVVDVCWEGPDNLPSLQEIRDPQRWLARVGLSSAVA